MRLEGGVLRLTPRMQKVLDRAATQAKHAGLEVVGVEHVFLAILDDDESVPTQVLSSLGVRDRVRVELQRVLDSPEYRRTAKLHRRADLTQPTEETARGSAR
jgi:ATP-dependent Clp protease ATP-binding subunit ClpA